MAGGPETETEAGKTAGRGLRGPLLLLAFSLAALAGVCAAAWIVVPRVLDGEGIETAEGRFEYGPIRDVSYQVLSFAVEKDGAAFVSLRDEAGRRILPHVFVAKRCPNPTLSKENGAHPKLALKARLWRDKEGDRSGEEILGLEDAACPGWRTK